jgi:hypothetical protein
MTLNQTDDDSYEWLREFEHQISFYRNENVTDISSPSAISTTSQSRMSDVMLDDLNDPALAGINTIWKSIVIGPSKMPNPFAMDLYSSVFPDISNGACLPLRKALTPGRAFLSILP